MDSHIFSVGWNKCLSVQLFSTKKIHFFSCLNSASLIFKLNVANFSLERRLLVSKVLEYSVLFDLLSILLTG
jgi:hypothetical protein